MFLLTLIYNITFVVLAQTRVGISHFVKYCVMLLNGYLEIVRVIRHLMKYNVIVFNEY